MKLALALVLTLASGDYPKQTGLVNDFAGVLDAPSKAKISASLGGLEKAKNFVLVVVTVKSLEGRSPEDYTVGLANAWGIGQKGKNNGIVFLVSPGDKVLRVENGYGAEATLTDIESKLIMEEQVVPMLKEGRISEGIAAGTEALVAKLGGGVAQSIKHEPEKAPVGLIIFIVVVILILMCFPAGRELLWAALQIAASSTGRSGGSSGSSKGSSGSGGGKFGGGGSTSKW